MRHTTRAGSDADLHLHLCRTLGRIQTQRETIMRDCEQHGWNPYELLTPDGGYVLAPLLAAEAQVLVALHGLEP